MVRLGAGMTWIFWLSLAVGGELRIEASLPAQVVMNGRQLADLITPSHVDLILDNGTHSLQVHVSGAPTTIDIEVSDDPALLFIGKSGVTSGQGNIQEMSDLPPGRMEFRNASGDPIMVVVDRKRHRIPPASTVPFELAKGQYPFDARNGDGTVIWSAGTLHVKETGKLVVQVSHGRMPETAGPGGTYWPRGK
jgi:hypothetical protein